MRRVILILAGTLIVILSGCSKYVIPAPECPEGDQSATFTADIQPIFNTKCIGCHSGNQSPELSAGWSYQELTEGGYVAEPDNACESILYQIFSGTHNGRATEEEVLKILGWIQAGAQEN